MKVETLLRNARQESFTRAEFASAARELIPQGLSLLETRLMIDLLREFDDETRPIKIRLISSYTVNLLESYFELHGLIHGFDVEIQVAPYGQLAKELHGSAADADFLYLLLQWSDLVPDFFDWITGDQGQSGEETETQLITNLTDLLTQAQKATSGVVVLSLLPRWGRRRLGAYDAMSQCSEIYCRSRLISKVNSTIHRKFPSIHFDDGHELTAALGRTAFDDRLWSLSHSPFTAHGSNVFVQNLFRFPVLTRTPRVKCLVLDADGVLWGGILGEDGMKGIQLGDSYPGSCFVEFQKRLLHFIDRGYVLALCSKNEHDDVLRVLNQHPHMVLREDHFGALHINWEPKPQSIAAIAEELNLGIDSLMFLDDSPHECRMMRELRPEVRVIRIPKEPIKIPTCLDHLQELEVLSHTDADRDRAKTYVANRKRKAAAVSFKSFDDYLRTLQMQITVHWNDEASDERLAQLSQRTNQFNLSMKRYKKSDVTSLRESKDSSTVSFTLQDVFGKTGIVGAAVLREKNSDAVELDSLFISCRVLGRMAEQAFLHALLETMKECDKTLMIAEYIPTEKNHIVKEFLVKEGFVETSKDCYEFSIDRLASRSPTREFIKCTVVGSVL